METVDTKKFSSMCRANIFYLSGDENPSINRIVPIQRLLELLATGSLVLRNPAKWDDPFENYVLKTTQNVRSYHANMFGQCWSLNGENDAMWRIYAPDKMGVKISTTVEKLFAAVCQSESIDMDSVEKCFIGKVAYLNLVDMRALTSAYKEAGKKILKPVETLLFKRMEFTHEAEVRLIYYDEEDGNTQVDEKHIKIKPFEIIQEIVFDPRMDKNLCAAFTHYIKNLGYEGDISQSDLYSYVDG